MIVRRGLGQNEDDSTAAVATTTSPTNWPLIIGVAMLVMIFIVPNLAGGRR